MRATTETPKVNAWQTQLAKALMAAGVKIATWVPDKRLAPIADALLADGLRLRTLTREEECVGFAAGHRAAGGMPLVLMQSSGLGNSLNALGSLAVPYGLGFPMIVSMRGTLGEQNPTQVPLGRAAVDMLELLGIECFSLRHARDITFVVDGALNLARSARQVAPIILEPDLVT